jgi:hypothetical protein
MNPQRREKNKNASRLYKYPKYLEVVKEYEKLLTPLIL